MKETEMNREGFIKGIVIGIAIGVFLGELYLLLRFQ